MKRPHSDPGPPLPFPRSPPGPKMAPAPPQPRGQPAPFDPPPPRWRTHLQPLGRAPGLACAASPPPHGPAFSPPLCFSIGRSRRPSCRRSQWRERERLWARGPPSSRARGRPHPVICPHPRRGCAPWRLAARVQRWRRRRRRTEEAEEGAAGGGRDEAPRGAGVTWGRTPDRRHAPCQPRSPTGAPAPARRPSAWALRPWRSAARPRPEPRSAPPQRGWQLPEQHPRRMEEKSSKPLKTPYIMYLYICMFWASISLLRNIFRSQLS